MKKRNFWLKGILLFIPLFLILTGCELENTDPDPAQKPPTQVEDPAQQGDLEGIYPELPSSPTHGGTPPAVINGTYSVAQIAWGQGVGDNRFVYHDGDPIRANVTVTAKTNYVFNKAIKEADILLAFGKVTGDIDDNWTISDDYTQLKFSFSYTVARAPVPPEDFNQFQDIIPVAGSSTTNLPGYVKSSSFTGIKTAAPIVYYNADDDMMINSIPSNGAFRAKIELEALYGYGFDNFEPGNIFRGADQIVGRELKTTDEKTLKLSFFLYYEKGLSTIDATDVEGGIDWIFEKTSAVAAGKTVPDKVTLNPAALFSAATLQWKADNLAEKKIVYGGQPISVTLELIPGKGYTFSGTDIKTDDIKAAFTIPVVDTTVPPGGPNPSVPTVTEVTPGHNLIFTLAYTVTYALIVPEDLTKLITGDYVGSTEVKPLGPFRAPRVGRPVQKEVPIHKDALFEDGTISWSYYDGGGFLQDNYVEKKTVATVTLKAKENYLFSSSSSDIGNFNTKITNIFKDIALYGAPTVVIKETPAPGRTLVFTLTYDKINPQIIILGNTASVTQDIINTGGGLREIFDIVDTVKITASTGTTSNAVSLTTDPVIPAGKTLELASNITVEVKASKGLDVQGNIVLGNGSILKLPDNSTNDEIIHTIGGVASLSGTTGSETETISVGKKNVLNFTGKVTATNVKIVSEGDNAGGSQINIPKDATLTINDGASLVLSKQPRGQNVPDGYTGVLNGKVIVAYGGRIEDLNENRGAWDVSDGSIVINYGGVGIIYDDTNKTTPFVPNITVGIISTQANEPKKGKYIQLAENAVFTIKRDEYVIDGKILLVSNFQTSLKVTVNGWLDVQATLSLAVTENNQVTQKGSIVGGSDGAILQFSGENKSGQLDTNSKITTAASGNTTTGDGVKGTTYTWISGSGNSATGFWQAPSQSGGKT
jgi:hypothetical protein